METERGLFSLHLAVVVAVVAVGMVQVVVNQVIDMIPVRHRLVATRMAVLVPLLVATAGMLRRAARRIRVVEPVRRRGARTTIGGAELELIDELRERRQNQ